MGKVVKILIGLGIVAAAVVGAYAFIQSRDNGDTGPKKVEVVTGSITDKAVAVGKIEPRLKFKVKSKISGIVKRCYAEVGDTIKTGDPLFDIVPDPTPTERVEVERRLELAQNTYDRAAAEMERANTLSISGILSKGDHDLKREAFEQARIQLAQAKDNLELLQKGRIQGGGAGMESIVRASAAGTLLERLVNPGDPVVPLTSYQAGTDLATRSAPGGNGVPIEPPHHKEGPRRRQPRGCRARGLGSAGAAPRPGASPLGPYIHSFGVPPAGGGSVAGDPDGIAGDDS